METIVVTRHPALVTVLVEDGIVPADVPVLAQATGDDVRGKRVIGVLPLFLAAEADSLTTVDLRLPPEMRGTELTAAQVREYMTGYTTYRVERVAT